MSKRIIPYIVATAMILAFSAVSMAAIPVKVAINKGTIITLKEPSKRVSLTNPEIADLNVLSPYEILINGKKIGTTNLIVWDTKGKPTFFDVIVMGDITTLEEQIKEMAPDSGVVVETVGDAIVIRGSLTNEQTKSKIDEIAKAYAPNKDKVINLMEVKEAQQVVLEVRVAQVDKTKLKELGASFILQGINGNNAEATFPGFNFSPSGTLGSLRTLETLVPGVVLKDIDPVTGAPIYGVDVVDRFLGKSDLWPSITGFDLNTNNPQIGVAHFPSGVTGLLRALSSKGLAKILAEPNLVVRSGEEGKFHVGTRFPIQTVQGVGANATVSITYEEVGIRLNFAPQVLESGAIRLKIDPAEVSNIQDFVRLQNLVAPVVDTRTVRTNVDLNAGESLILAGLLSEDMKKNIQKVPLFGDIPILGALFRSTTDELREKELVFFITPKLVKPIPPGVKPELPGEKPLTKEEEREFQWVPVPKEHEE